jgi:hypothetical protein
MVGRLITLAILLAAGVMLCGHAAQPELQPGVRIVANGQPIDVQIGHLVPCVADWNGDGKKDLLVGTFMNAEIRLYINQGTDAAPEFKDFVTMQAGGKPIRLDAG